MKDKRSMFVAASIVLTAVLISSMWYCYFKPIVHKEGFEESLGEWVVGSDVPLDPNNPEHTVAWNITRSTDVSKSGQYSLKLFIDGRQDDGTIWVERKISLAVGRIVKIKISFKLYSESESFNTIAVVCAYIGLREPLREEDFAVLGPANTVEGWETYAYEEELNTGLNGEVWVAVGISVRWETLMTYYIDDVEVFLE